MCASFSDIDECANPRDVCPYLTECINTVGSYICDCKEAGFKADGKQCLGTLCVKYQRNRILHVVIGPDGKLQITSLPVAQVNVLQRVEDLTLLLVQFLPNLNDNHNNG